MKSEAAPKTDLLLKTDRNGLFSTKGISPGNYTVTVFVDRETKWIAPHVSAATGKTVHIDLNGKQIAAASRGNKRATWVLDKTGSHLTGHWSDEPDRGPEVGQVERVGTEEFARYQRALGGQH